MGPRLHLPSSWSRGPFSVPASVLQVSRVPEARWAERSRRHLNFVGSYGLGGSDWHQPNGHSHYLGLAPVPRCRGSSASEG